MQLVVKGYNSIYKLNIMHRLNVILGNSGIGKTVLYDLVEIYNRDNTSGVTINSKLPVKVCPLSDWKDTIRNKSNTIFICDEFDVICEAKFSEYYSQYAIKNNLWFIISSRIDTRCKNLNYRKLSYSVNAMYTLRQKDGILYNVPYYDYSIVRKNNVSIDCVLVEDKNAGFTFFSSMLKHYPVFSSEGKSNLYNVILRLIKKGYKNILVFADMAALGCHIQDISAISNSTSDINIYLIDIYECFEYLLLRTNLLRNKNLVLKEFNNIEYFANQTISWENYFEDLIKRVTDNKVYRHTHKSNLKKCYYEDCNVCNPSILEKCDIALYGNKFIEMLKGTEFEFLLKYL